MKTDDKVFNEVDVNYTGRTEIIYSRKVEVNHETPELFNGFKAEFNLLDTCQGDVFSKIVTDRLAIPEVRFNHPDESLYVVVLLHFKERLSDEELAEVKKEIGSKINKEVVVASLGKEKYTINLSGFEGIDYIKQSSLEAPDGFMFIEELFKDEKDSLMYPEFLNHEQSFLRLKKLCKKLGYEVTDEMITGVMLPIHRKHATTGAMLVHKEVEHYYAMYQLAQNYLRGFEEGSNEHSLGIVMTVDIKFNDYVLRAAKRLEEEGKGPDPDNFTDEFNRAVKRINK